MPGIPSVVASTGVCVPFAVIGPRGDMYSWPHFDSSPRLANSVLIPGHG